MKKNPEARRWWKQAVLQIAMNQCELRIDDNCAGVAHDAHHLIGASYKRYEYDMRNGMAVCRHCHNWIHTHDGEFVAWLEENRMDLVDWIMSGHVNYKSPRQEEIDVEIRLCRNHIGLDPYGYPEGNASVGT